MITPGGVEVEVKQVHTDNRGIQWAHIKALNGEPFTHYSDGGPYMTNWSFIRLDLLNESFHNITIAPIGEEVLNGEKVGQK